MAGAVVARPSRCQRAASSGGCETRYLDEAATRPRRRARLDRRRRRRRARAVSVGLLGNAADVLPELVPPRRAGPTWSPTRPSRTTRSTAICPPGWSLEQRGRAARRRATRQSRRSAARPSIVRARAGDAATSSRMGVPTVDYGNNIRQVALDAGRDERLRRSPASCRPTSGRCSAEGDGPVPLGRAVGRSGGHLQDRRQTMKELFPRQRPPAPLAGHGAASASPSRACRRASAGSAWASATARASQFNEMVASGELKAPIVIGRDHLDSGSVASPNRETEAMRDGSDAVSDWPLLNALLNTAGGATWVSLHHGGGVGMGYSQHAGVVIVARRHAEAAEAARARAVERPRHRRHAPRRRGLRHRHRRRAASRASTCRCLERR